jgi:hypothetical protein
MANPNIVAVASIYGESIGKGLSTDVTTVILTVLANKLLKINYISVTNLHATVACDVTVKITKASGGFTSAGVAAGDDEAGIQSLASTVSCPADDVLVVLDKPIYLMELDDLQAGASGAADIFISYEVISV